MTDEAHRPRSANEHFERSAPRSSSDHIDVDTLARHAAGQLSPANARVVNEHLLACDDGRCGAFVRSQMGHVESASRLPAGGYAPEPQTEERTFQSRELVWTTFEAMARELAVPIDALINEAMTAYAQVRGYAVASSSSRETREAQTTQAPPPKPSIGRISVPAVPSARAERLLEETHDALAVISEPGEFLDETRTTPRRPAIVAPSSMGRPAREPDPTLVLTYRGLSYPVNKIHFVIGRSKSQSDLRLDDPNVSRQHAAIERVGSTWYIVDLGSTNGVHVADERVTRRPLADGDVLVITSHEIRCSVG